MREFTVKNIVENLRYVDTITVYALTLLSHTNKVYYRFIISRGKVHLYRGDTLDFLVKEEVSEVASYPLPPNFRVVSFEETQLQPNGDLYENTFLNVKYEVQVFSKLFKILRDRIHFTVFFKGEHIDCFFIGGKVMYVEETDDLYKVVITDLYELHRTLPHYIILSINGKLPKYDFRSFLKEHNRIADVLGKVFQKSSNYPERR